MDLIPRNFFLDDVFDNFLTSRDNNRFKCDIYEQGDNYCIEMEAPGVTKEDLTIECDNGYLTVKISKNEENNAEDKNYIRKERSSKEFQRSFYIGDIDASNIKASFKDGMLNIVLPKVKEVETKTTIQID